MHIYHVASGTPVAAILRPARTPKGTEVRTVIKHVTKRLRWHWPQTRIVWRGDSHYGRVEAMEWAEGNGADYIFGLAGNVAFDALAAETADNLRFHHAKSSQTQLRTYASFIYQASSWWTRLRKVMAPTGVFVAAGHRRHHLNRYASGGRHPAMSSPRSRARRSIFTRTSIASAGRWRT